LADLMPHGSLQRLSADIHWLRGSVRMGPGIRIPRLMVVLRHEGQLTLINAVRVDERAQAALAELGTIAHVVRIGTHGMDDDWYADVHGATRWAMPGVDLQGAVERLSADHLPVPWLSLFRFEHTNDPEAALLADRDGGVLVTCDSLQSWPDLQGCSLLAKPLTVAMGFTRRPVIIGGPWARRMTPAGGSLEPDYRRLLQLPFRHLVGGHGAPCLDRAPEEIRATVDATWGAARA